MSANKVPRFLSDLAKKNFLEFLRGVAFESETRKPERTSESELLQARIGHEVFDMQ